MGKRPLVFFTLALLGGLFFSEAFLYFPLALSLSVLILLFVEGVFFRGRLLSFPLFLVGLLAFLIHQISAVPFSDRDLQHYIDGHTIRIVAQVSGPLRHDPRRVRLQMKAQTIYIADKTLPLRGDFHLNIWEKEIPFEYGDSLEMQIKLRRPGQFQNEGAFQYADYRERTGWSGVANLSNLDRIKKVGEGGNPVLKHIFRWRDEIRKRILSAFAPPSGALLMALVIGETGYLPDEVREHFAASGTAHLLAVSGAHLAFVSLFVFGFVRYLLLKLPEALLLRLTLWKMPSQWAALFTAGAAIFYTFFAGAKIGTLRALSMILIYLLSIWLGRNRDAMTALALAALFIILFEIRAVFEISFQLSFLSVLFILLMMSWQQKQDDLDSDDGLEDGPSFYQKFVAGPASLMMTSTIGAIIGTAPLVLYYFHQFSWVALFSNLIVLPLVGWLVVPIGLLISLGALLFSEGFPFADVLEAGLSYFYALVSFFAELPGANFHFAAPPLWLIILYYIVFSTIFILKKPRSWLLFSLLSFGLLFFGWGGIRIAPAHLRVTFLDVAQGDATLIEFANGKTLLIDGGTKTAGKFGVAPYLWQHRIRTIDMLLATHPQFDHMGGLPYLIRAFNVGTVWSNGRENKAAHYRDFQKALKSKGLEPRIINNQSPPLMIDNCRLSFLNPGIKDGLVPRKSNNDSIVLHLSCLTPGEKMLSFLFTGDIEAEAETILLESAADLKSHILKVPHHGSRSSSGESFISAISPNFAIISAGRKNRYHHPHKEVLAVYASQGIKIYRSDQEGAITFVIKPDQEDSVLPLQVSSYRDSKIKRILWSDEVATQEWENIKAFFRPLS